MVHKNSCKTVCITVELLHKSLNQGNGPYIKTIEYMQIIVFLYSIGTSRAV